MSAVTAPSRCAWAPREPLIGYHDRGFKFVGSTICYAFMQATGMVNDHTLDCFRHRELTA
jgi:hypothetical protein